MRGCSEKTVRRRIAEGKLPVIRTGRRVGIHPRHTYSDL
jgi:excisionase family DNA binding protein